MAAQTAPARAAPPDRRSTPTSSTSSSCRAAVERHVDRRRPRHPGLVHPRRQGPAQPAGHRDPRRPAHALRLVAGLGVPGPRGGRDQRLLLQPARLRGLRPGLQRRATTATGAPGPTRDVLAGVDALVADGLADPERLGVTGGSYGGYLTNWIVGHDQRFRAAMTCRSRQRHGDAVPDRRHQRRRLGARSSSTRRRGSDPAYFREISPITYAERIRTPLLIQHSERDIRTTIGQAEALFTVLRSLAPTGPAAARPRGDPRADPLGHAVPPRREPRDRRSAGSATSSSRASAACRRCPRSAPAASPRSGGRRRPAQPGALDDERPDQHHDARAAPGRWRSVSAVAARWPSAPCRCRASSRRRAAAHDDRRRSSSGGSCSGRGTVPAGVERHRLRRAMAAMSPVLNEPPSRSPYVRWRRSVVPRDRVADVDGHGLRREREALRS